MTKFALLIGVSEYVGLNPLPSAVADVEAMQGILVDPQRGEFLAENIRSLKNPNKQDMEDAIYWLFYNREKKDLLLFYFSGHGIEDHNNYKELYLATTITRKQNGRLYHPSAIPAAYLRQQIESSQSQQQVIILDCCYSGAVAYGMSLKDDGNVKVEDYLGGKGRAILTSSAAKEGSMAGKIDADGSIELSIYTNYLVEGLTTGEADLDKDGTISVEELHEYASRKVKVAFSAMSPQLYRVSDGSQIVVAKSPTDPKLKYERLLQKKYSDENWRELSDLVQNKLLRKQHEWGLSSAEAAAIKERVLLYRDKLIEYEQGLTGEIQKQYPISAKFQAELTEFQKEFKLRDEDIADIRRRVLPQAHPTQSNPVPAAIPTAISATVPQPPAIEPPQSIIALSTFSFKTAQVAFEIISQKYLLILRLGVCALFITSIPYLLLNTSLFGKKHPSDEKIYTITTGLDSDWRISIEENSNGVSNRAVTSWTQKTGKNSQFKLIRDRSNESYEIRPRVADNWGACLSISTDSILSQNKCNGTLNQKFIIDCEKKDIYNNLTACSIINRNSNNVIGVEWDNPDKKNPIRESSAYDPANARWWSFVVSE